MEELSETYPPQLTIAIYEKWNHQAHGIKQGEEDYINYFNTKNLALCSFNKEDLIYDGTIDCIDFIHYVRGLEPERTFEINTIIMYRYKNRDFCFKHNGVEKFQTKSKSKSQPKPEKPPGPILLGMIASCLAILLYQLRMLK